MTAARGLLPRLGDPLFRSRTATRRLFGVDPGPLDHDAFDFATLALRRGLAAWVGPAERVLEIGTGPAAPLAFWLHRRGIAVVAIESDPTSAERARALAAEQAPGLAIACEVFGPSSDLRGATVVVANPPYVPSERGRDLGLDPEREHAWSGGEDGLDGYRAIGKSLAKRFGGAVIVGGCTLFHAPQVAAEAMERVVLRSRRWGPGWAAWTD